MLRITRSLIRKTPLLFPKLKSPFLRGIYRFSTNDNPKKDPEEDDKSKSKKKKEEKKNEYENSQWVNMAERLRGSYNENPNLYNLFGFASLITFLLLLKDEGNRYNELGNYSDFINDLIPNHKIEKVVIDREQKGSIQRYKAILHLVSGKVLELAVGNPDAFLENLEYLQVEMGTSLESLIPVEFSYQKDIKDKLEMGNFILGKVLSLMIIIIVWRSVRGLLSQLSKGNLFGIGKSEVKQYNVEKSVKIKFDDVAGLGEAKVEIKEFVDFLRNFEKFKAIGARIPKGALLVGPPGTGKTMLAKACAGEAGVPFFYASGSDFVEMYVGLGASRVRELFENAKTSAPAIIFIDEIDAIGKKRASLGMGGNDEKDNTLNQLLVEMDGFDTNSNVVVLAATNISDSLDPALTRPGRFDRSIELTLPDIEGRKQILLVHLKPIKLNPEKTVDEYANRLSTLTPGFSGADLANLCNEAAIHAARKEKAHVDSNDFEMASEKVMAGIEKRLILSEQERRRVAIHESGHAVVSWFLEGGAPLIKLTIIPRSKGALGFAQYLPSENSLQTQEEIEDSICCALGGRMAEQLLTGEISSGAADDLEKVHKYAEALVKRLGMSSKIGLMGFIDHNFKKTLSETQLKEIDLEINSIIQRSAEKTIALVQKYKSLIENLSEELLSKETLDLKEIKSILGERPFAPKSNYKAYLETKES